MALHTEVDMSTVPEVGELIPEGNYLCRITEVKEEGDDGSQLLSKSGNPIVNFVLKVQDEGPAMGRPIYITASLQPNALFTLKALYTACGYQPGPEGHDPSKILDGELYVNVKHKDYEGRKVTDIPVAGIRAVSKGPLQLRS